MMAKVQRIKKVELWSMWRILGVASIAALIAFSLTFGLAVAVDFAVGQDLGPAGDIGVVVLCMGGIGLLFGLPAAIVIRHHPKLRRWWHGFAFGVAYGLMGTMVTVLWFEVDFYLSVGGRTSIPGLLNMTARIGLVVSVVTGVLIVCVWSASRGSRGKLLITDKTYCPSCGYNLVGNTTYICSECGQPFTLEELEITAQDLEPVQ
jgi:DNA-directed RNA polymerase subunit RPC12/RpoP